jgi:hypothetical protein
METCNSLGLNPLTRPFDYISLNGKLTLYARKDCTDQMRNVQKVSLQITSRDVVGDVYIVTARATTADGRCDESTGVVVIAGLKGDALANAYMKAECVPLDSEILTRNGFKKYNELTIGEEVLAYDGSADECKWTPLQEVSVYDKQPIVAMSTAGTQFIIRCTKEHSWAVRLPGYKECGTGERKVRGPYKKRGKEIRLIQTNEMNTSGKVIMAAPQREPETSLLDPFEAQVLGWAVTDGTIKRVGNYVRIGICQSKEENFSAIRSLMDVIAPGYKECITPARMRTFPTGKTCAVKPQYWWYLPGDISKYILQKADFRTREDLPKIVTRLSPPARRAMLDVMMMADGDKNLIFAKGHKPVIEAFEILCALEGIATGRTHAKDTIFTKRMRKTRHTACVNLAYCPAGIEDVWCPTTQYGTWVMRQNGQVVITGNTKAKRRVTLSLCGLGFTDESEVETIPGARSVQVDMSTGEILDAPAKIPAPVDNEPTKPQMQKAHILGAAKYGTDKQNPNSRNEFLDFCSDVAQRTIKSTKELTKAEISTVIDELEQLPDFTEANISMTIDELTPIDADYDIFGAE